MKVGVKYSVGRSLGTTDASPGLETCSQEPGVKGGDLLPVVP